VIASLKIWPRTVGHNAASTTFCGIGTLVWHNSKVVPLALVTDTPCNGIPSKGGLGASVVVARAVGLANDLFPVGHRGCVVYDASQHEIE